MIVVDASLAVKWMLWGTETPRAIDFLDRHGDDLRAPDLLFIEVAGVIVSKGNQNKAFQADALRALDKWTIAWSDHVVRNHRVTQRRLFQASSMALRLGTPLKDCVYLALAMELNCDLATCDVKFRDKAYSLYPGIKLLTDYSDPSESSE